MIIEDVNDDTATVAELGMKSLSAEPGVWAVLGKAVDATMQL